MIASALENDAGRGILRLGAPALDRGENTCRINRPPAPTLARRRGRPSKAKMPHTSEFVQSAGASACMATI